MTDRADLVAGVRALADWIEAHPEVLVARVRAESAVLLSEDGELGDEVRAAEVHRLAGIMEAEVEVSPAGHVRATRQFTPPASSWVPAVTFEVFMVPADALADALAALDAAEADPPVGIGPSEGSR